MNQLADAVRVTLGPKGRNVVLDKKWGAPRRSPMTEDESAEHERVPGESGGAVVVVVGGAVVVVVVAVTVQVVSPTRKNEPSTVCMSTHTSMCPYEKIGAELVKEVAKKTDDVAGDGTTTATATALPVVGRPGMPLLLIFESLMCVPLFHQTM